ncbi:hypothetical protein [Streptomyces sp. NPDC048106]|uniref:hypothetical protein n=1 Tax=Streptomyces sp. NPDC048106 TaxID=3155750 RepID=UPI003453E918
MIEIENQARTHAERLMAEAERHRLAREVARARRRARRTARAWAGGAGRGGEPHPTPPRWRRPLRTG